MIFSGAPPLSSSMVAWRSPVAGSPGSVAGLRSSSLCRLIMPLLAGPLKNFPVTFPTRFTRNDPCMPVSSVFILVLAKLSIDVTAFSWATLDSCSVDVAASDGASALFALGLAEFES